MLNPLDTIGFTLHRDPQLLLKPLNDFASPLYSLSQKVLSYDEALRVSHQWIELAARIVLFVAYSYGIRKMSFYLYESVSNWTSHQLKPVKKKDNKGPENLATRRFLSSFIVQLKYNLKRDIPEQIVSSKTIDDFFENQVKTGKLFGLIASGIFAYAGDLILTYLEYKTSSLIFSRYFYSLFLECLSLTFTPVSLWTLNNAHASIYNLRRAELAELILARLNLLSPQQMKCLDPRAIAELSLEQILFVIPYLPQEMRNLPIDALLQKISGHFLQTVQFLGETRGLLTPLIESCASSVAPYMARAFGYARV